MDDLITGFLTVYFKKSRLLPVYIEIAGEYPDIILNVSAHVETVVLMCRQAGGGA